MTSTDTITLTRGEHSRVIIKDIVSRYLGIILSVIGAILLLGWMVDDKFYFLVPILIFLIVPLLMLMAYSSAATTVESAFSSRPHVFELEPQSLIYKELKTMVSSTEEGQKREFIREFVYPLSEVEEVRDDVLGHIIRLRGSRSHFLIIPRSEVNDEFVERLKFRIGMEKDDKSPTLFY